MKISIRHIHILTFIVLVSISSCSKPKSQDVAATAASKRAFTLPDIPSNLLSENERVSYMLAHYWDNYDFQDTLVIKDPNVTEQAVVNYINLFRVATPDEISVSIKNMLSKSQNNPLVFKYFTSVYEKYLYDPNSPMRDDRFYIPVLEFIVESPRVQEIDKTRPKAILQLAQKNLPGMKATDFAYITASGKVRRVSDVKAELTILLFYVPGCKGCELTIKEISSNPRLVGLIESGKLKVLAIYAEGDLQEWKKYQPSIPYLWINGCDTRREIIKKSLYDLKASPTIYLLSRDKEVLLKDTTIPQLIQFITQ